MLNKMKHLFRFFALLRMTKVKQKVWIANPHKIEENKIIKNKTIKLTKTKHYERVTK